MGLYVAPMTFSEIMLTMAWALSVCTSLLLLARARYDRRTRKQIEGASDVLRKHRDDLHLDAVKFLAERDQLAVKLREAKRSLDAQNQARLDAELDAIHGERRL
jgi:hypothetical protein